MGLLCVTCISDAARPLFGLLLPAPFHPVATPEGNTAVSMCMFFTRSHRDRRSLAFALSGTMPNRTSSAELCFCTWPDASKELSGFCSEAKTFPCLLCSPKGKFQLSFKGGNIHEPVLGSVLTHSAEQSTLLVCQ